MAIKLDIVEETGSTNADLLARISGEETIAEGHWLVADRQTRGKGRQGRNWLDGPGNFMGSTIVHLSSHDPPPASLSFASALAVHETLATRIADPRALRLKWPNDILLRDAKLCGILLEREGNHVVIGIGVNLAAAPLLQDRRTESLAHMGPAPDRDLFARDLARHFDSELGRWRQFGAASLFDRWMTAAHPLGTRMSMHDERGKPVSGLFEGLEPDGALRLRLPDGGTRVIHAGDVMLESD